MVASSPGGLMGWVQQYGQYILFFAQLLYWTVLCVAAVWATLLFRKLVAFRTGEGESVKPPVPSVPAVAPATEGASTVSVEEFVD